MSGVAALADSRRFKTLWGSGRVLAPGLAATIVVALASTYLSDHYRAPPVIFALLLGMALNTLSAE
ncbi:MAG: putative sulfate exporter family transporter, partial [Gammaproteobacteria bacterium]|nr:putative sulfate exporter family transporter [Gammaproteobacteria bacterium]